MWRLTIDGNPQEQTRPRIVRRGPHAGLADTVKVRDYKAYCKAMIALSKPDKLIDGPCAVTVCIYVEKPASWPKKRVHADRKPDVDNFVKLIFDCLEGLVYTNDSRVVELHAAKRLSSEPRVEISVIEVE